MAPIRIFPPSTVANDVASVTIAGHTFASAGGAAGGILNLRISLRGSTLAELARVLARLEGVRVTSGPAIASRGDCYLVHAPGFKMVLSAPAPGGDYAPALLSRTIDSNPPKLAATCDLSAVFAGLMSAPPPLPRIEESPVAEARAAAAAPGSFAEELDSPARGAPAGQDARAQGTAHAQDPAPARDLVQVPKLGGRSPHAADDAAGTSGLAPPVTTIQSCQVARVTPMWNRWRDSSSRP